LAPRGGRFEPATAGCGSCAVPLPSLLSRGNCPPGERLSRLFPRTQARPDTWRAGRVISHVGRM